MWALDGLLFAAGAVIVAGTVMSAIRTVVLPRGSPTLLGRLIFFGSRTLFDLRMRFSRTYEARDRIFAYYAPMTVLFLPVAWLGIILGGYTAMFLALDIGTWREALVASGSSLLTLGFATVPDLPSTLLAFSEAGIGLALLALIISYLPTMYGAFSRREKMVSKLTIRAGEPPTALEFILRNHRIQGLEGLGPFFAEWEDWFVEIEESHTSLAVLSLFRSQRSDRSWVTAAGAVLDCGALVSSTLDVPRQRDAELCIRAGYLALREIASFFGVHYDRNPSRGDPVSITREEFDAVCDQLAAEGVALRPDRETAWLDFTGWRVNYDTVLIALASLTMAPHAPWSSDRAPVYRPSQTFVRRQRA